MVGTSTVRPDKEVQRGKRYGRRERRFLTQGGALLNSQFTPLSSCLFFFYAAFAIRSARPATGSEHLPRKVRSAFSERQWLSLIP